MDLETPNEGEKIGFTRQREEDDVPGAEGDGPSSKKPRIESAEESNPPQATITEAEVKNAQKSSGESVYIIEDLLPPSRSLLPSSKLVERPADKMNMTFEADVGITEYVSDVPPIQGIIKQR